MRKQLFPFVLALFMLPVFFLVGYNFGASSRRATTEKAIKVAEEHRAVAAKWEELYNQARELCAR